MDWVALPSGVCTLPKDIPIFSEVSEIEVTLKEYDSAFAACSQLFEAKTSDYGTAWRILRPSSLTDQLFIKANRIRTIQETELTKVDEGIESEFIGIVNYSLMAIIQCGLAADHALELPAEEAVERYLTAFQETRDLMVRKNHDYGEAWRDMRVSSLTDLILMKVLRVKQIEDNGGQTKVSEGIEANYQDMANYALFALILLKHKAV
tara:strand:- start:740 stop:1360 length:621 start_codon:yes stop_codon:yes gene_type:complete